MYRKVLASCTLTEVNEVGGGVADGRGGYTPIMRRGLAVADTTLARQLLPNPDGAEYDSYHVATSKDSIEIIDRALEYEGDDHRPRAGV